VRKRLSVHQYDLQYELEMMLKNSALICDKQYQLQCRINWSTLELLVNGAELDKNRKLCFDQMPRFHPPVPIQRHEDRIFVLSSCLGIQMSNGSWAGESWAISW
jgi:hypothetical protein